MGLFKDYVSQTRKPEGFLGKIMLKGMNSQRLSGPNTMFPIMFWRRMACIMTENVRNSLIPRTF